MIEQEKPVTGIRCQCGSVDTEITHTRRSKSGTIRRRRLCHACNRPFWTIESSIAHARVMQQQGSEDGPRS